MPATVLRALHNFTAFIWILKTTHEIEIISPFHSEGTGSARLPVTLYKVALLPLPGNQILPEPNVGITGPRALCPQCECLYFCLSISTSRMRPWSQNDLERLIKNIKSLPESQEHKNCLPNQVQMPTCFRVSSEYTSQAHGIV